MHANIRDGATLATNIVLKNGSHKLDIARTEPTIPNPESDWFVRATKALLPKNAGSILSLWTGWPESTCWRYARNGNPSASFLETLYGLECGEPWWRASMEGNRTKWWKEIQVAERVKRAIDSVDLNPNGASACCADLGGECEQTASL